MPGALSWRRRFDFHADYDTREALVEVLRRSPGIAKRDLFEACRGKVPYPTLFATLEMIVKINQVILFKRGQRHHCLLVESIARGAIQDRALLALSMFTPLDAQLTYEMSKKREPMTIAELFNALGKPKSMIHRRLQALAEDGFFIKQVLCPGNPVLHNRNTCFEFTRDGHVLWEFAAFRMAFGPDSLDAPSRNDT